MCPGDRQPQVRELSPAASQLLAGLAATQSILSDYANHDAQHRDVLYVDRLHLRVRGFQFDSVRRRQIVRSELASSNAAVPLSVESPATDTDMIQYATHRYLGRITGLRRWVHASPREFKDKILKREGRKIGRRPKARDSADPGLRCSPCCNDARRTVAFTSDIETRGPRCNAA